MIPLYSCDGAFLRQISVDMPVELRDHVTVVKNRRNNPTRAYFKGLSADYLQAFEKGRGKCFEQALTSGTVFALRGVVGS